MPQCQVCHKKIEWIKARGKNIPVDGEGNILQTNGGSAVGINKYGEFVWGIQVGDANEQGYIICKIKHVCEGGNKDGSRA